MKMRKHGLGNCEKCPTRDICTELCSEADAFADKDKVLQRHELLGDRIYGFQDSAAKMELFQRLNLTPKQEKVVTLIAFGIPSSIIIDVLDISDSYIRVLMHRIKKTVKAA